MHALLRLGMLGAAELPARLAGVTGGQSERGLEEFSVGLPHLCPASAMSLVLSSAFRGVPRRVPELSHLHVHLPLQSYLKILFADVLA